MDNLDEIVKIDIEIATPASSDASFNNILLVVSAPEEEGEVQATGVFSIAKAADLLDYGYTTTSQTYIAATVAFSQTPTPDKLYFVVREKEELEEEYEPIAEVLNEAVEYGGWYGLALESTFSDKETILEVIKWTEANNKMFCFTLTDIAQLPDTAGTVYLRSFGIYAGNVDAETQPEENKYAGVAWMAKCFGYDPGSETWAFKELASIAPSKLTNSLKTQLSTANITYYTTYAGKNITSADGGKVVGNEWIDTIRFRDWLKNYMQEIIFNLFVGNSKIQFTDNGITAIESKMLEALKRGQEVGGIAPTEYTEDGVEVPGYTTSVPKSTSLTESEKASRKLTGCKFTARLAGAIQMVHISGTVRY